MKKILALLLALLLVVGTFAACGGKSSDKDDPDDEYEENEEEKKEKETVIGENSESNAENDGNENAEHEEEPLVESTAGLEFVLNEDGKGYTLVGKGTCTATEIVIDGYNGLPVTSIGEDAFYKCTNLTSVTIGNSVTSIGNSAFDDCYNLTSVTIGNSVTSIGDYAFEGCDSLTSVTIGNDVTSIGYAAFYNCSSLTSVTIGNSVTSIGENAFNYCYKLVEVINKSSLTFIKGSYSYGHVAYHALEIHNGESKIVNESGYLFYTVDGVNYLVNYVGNDTELTFPANYNGENYVINDYAFYNNNKITKVTIPDSITSIGSDAFRECDNLTSVTIGSGVTSIGDYAFYHCNSLTSVTIGNGVMSIGEYAFYDCINLTSVTIGSGVTSIGNWAFYSCDSLTSVTIGNSVTSIGKDAFYNTAYYKNESNWENGVLYIGKYLIDAKETISGAYTIKSGTKLIADSAFYDCTNLTSVTIGNSVTSIGEEAFYKCSDLVSVTIPNSVTSIGSYAFRYCSNLTSVTIGNGVTSIGEHAFAYCDSLKSVYYDGDIASWCNISFGSNNANPVYYAKKFYIKKSGTNEYELLTNLVIPDSVTEIKDYAFENCDSLTSITIPDGVTSIGDWAFGATAYYDNESNWENGALYIGKYLIDAKNDMSGTYTVKEGTKLIADSAFAYCDSLTSVTIPNSVTSIGDRAFYDCSNLTSITVDENNIAYKSMDGNLYSKDGKALIQYARGKTDTSFAIPDSVTSIGSYAFEDCTNLTSVTIPNGVTSIGDDAFKYCYKLVEVINKSSLTLDLGSTSNGYVAYYALEVHAGDSKIKTQGDYQFYTVGGVNYLVNYIGNDIELTLPANYNGENYVINKYAFYYNDKITKVTIPDSVTSIGDSAFYYCTNLTSITIGNGVTSIGNYAFNDCSSLTSVYYDGDIASWCNISFGYDANPVDYANNLYIKKSGTNEYELLTNLVIPDSVTEIKAYAFCNCSNLTSITIPDSVKSIGASAFENCSNLTSIKYRGTEEQWGNVSKSYAYIPSPCVITYNYTGE